MTAIGNDSANIDTSSNANLSGSWHQLVFPINTQNITTSGELKLIGVPNNFHITANATGTAYEQPLLANININIVDRIANIKTFAINSGQSIVNLKGTIGEKLALNWDLNSPNLGELLPNASGDLLSQGSLNGDLKSPKLNASIKSNSISYNNTKLKQLDVVARGSFTNNSEPIDISANLKTVFQGSFELARDLELSIEGSGQNHSIVVNSTLFSQSNFSLLAEGGLNDYGWLGQLNKLNLDDPTYQQWRLSEPVNIESKSRALTAENACLANQSQKICVTLNADTDRLKIDGKANTLELANLNPLLSLYDMTLSGQVEGDFAYLKNTDQADSNLHAELNAQNSTLEVKTTEQTQQAFKLKSIKISLDQQPLITAKAQFLLESGDKVSADIAVDSNIESPDFDHANLRGRIVAQLSDLSEFQALSTPVSGLRGSLNANINLGGSIDSPTVGMQSQLKNGQFDIPDLGLSLTDIDLNATSVGRQNIEIGGNLTSGQGNLKVNGKLDFAKLDEPRFDLNLDGDNLALMSTHEINIDGNLNTDIVITKDSLELNGEIDLIQADLDFRLPENAILASKDVVLMGDKDEQEDTQQTINLTINLGDKTHINSQGLDASLTCLLYTSPSPRDS